MPNNLDLTDSLTSLYLSTKSLHKRFRTPINQPGSLEAKIMAFREEVDEIVDARDPMHVAEEMVDVIVTMIGILIERGGKLDDLQFAVDAVIRKNGAKTHETHYLAPDGKIRRREK